MDVQSRLAKIAAAHKAQLAAAQDAQTLAPAAPDALARLEKPIEQITAESRAAAQPVTAVRPPDVTEEVWASMTPDVRNLVCKAYAEQNGGQAKPINGPEVARGLAASATASVTGEDPAAVVTRMAGAEPPAEPKRGRGRPPKVATAAPSEALVQAPATTVVHHGPDLEPLIAELQANREQSAAIVKAINQLTEAVLGAAQILAAG